MYFFENNTIHHFLYFLFAACMHSGQGSGALRFGLNLFASCIYGGAVAQILEHVLSMHEVAGSIPASSIYVSRTCDRCTSDAFENIFYRTSGLVVEYIVAIDVTRVRFPADAEYY